MYKFVILFPGMGNGNAGGKNAFLWYHSSPMLMGWKMEASVGYLIK